MLLSSGLVVKTMMALFRRSALSLLVALAHIALLSSLCSAADPTVSYEFRFSYITVSPLGVPQQVRFLKTFISLSLSLYTVQPLLLLLPPLAFGLLLTAKMKSFLDFVSAIDPLESHFNGLYLFYVV